MEESKTDEVEFPTMGTLPNVEREETVEFPKLEQPPAESSSVTMEEQPSLV